MFETSSNTQPRCESEQSGLTSVDTRLYALITLTTIFGIGHHFDHVVRGNHVGWPLIPEVTVFTYTLAIYPLVAVGLYLTLTERVGRDTGPSCWGRSLSRRHRRPLRSVGDRTAAGHHRTVRERLRRLRCARVAPRFRRNVGSDDGLRRVSMADRLKHGPDRKRWSNSLPRVHDRRLTSRAGADLCGRRPGTGRSLRSRVASVTRPRRRSSRGVRTGRRPARRAVCSV